jgi:NADP-dependent aldehyde dehydrogenase
MKEPQDYHLIMEQSVAAFESYININATTKALFLESIANEIELLGDLLIETASVETNLPAARLIGERGRTTMQLRMFANMLREGSWVDAVIDNDIRKMLIPIGPIIVFGASNFPFAYSTAGGDTASALAAGCSVVVKAHPAHLQTSILVANAIAKAISNNHLPKHIFQHVEDYSFEAGKALVQDPLTAGVGFTGSASGGNALCKYASDRKYPIPVFAEMGSVNPVVLLPDTLINNGVSIAQQYASSITLGMGQFCTNPGILLAIESPALQVFLTTLVEAIDAVTPAKMLHQAIHDAYQSKHQQALTQKGVEQLNNSLQHTNTETPIPIIAKVSGIDFLLNELLLEEVFGPYSLVVCCKDEVELKAVHQSLKGQLTTTIMGTDDDLSVFSSFINESTNIAGRIVFNGVPTGVEVCNAMVHGGPSPASSDSRFTAVGVNAVKRWVRPICYQNAPQYVLPNALKNENPLKIWRLKNNVFGKE